jgi:hypothetical protein
MSKQIHRMFDIQDGKRYFILQIEPSGIIRSGIARATVTEKGSPLIDQIMVNFVTESTEGDLTPGSFSKMNYIAELDD